MNSQLAVLGDRGVIEVAGDEARSFLQRLVTSDVTTLKAGEARFAALLTPQGKITADFFVLADPAGAERFLLDVPAALAPELAKRLTLYRLRAKVEIVDRSAELGVLAVAPEAIAPAEAILFDDPRADGLWRRGLAPRGTLDHMGDDAGRWAYREARIRAGIPEGGLDFVYGEAFPHEANLDRLHGVDFKKGCYVGQEVVSRVEHRGTARRRIVPVAFAGEPPAIGDDITLNGTSIGTMGSAIEGLGLGLVRLDRVEEAGGNVAPPALLAGATRVRLALPGAA